MEVQRKHLLARSICQRCGAGYHQVGFCIFLRSTLVCLRSNLQPQNFLYLFFVPCICSEVRLVGGIRHISLRIGIVNRSVGSLLGCPYTCAIRCLCINELEVFDIFRYILVGVFVGTDTKNPDSISWLELCCQTVLHRGAGGRAIARLSGVYESACRGADDKWRASACVRVGRRTGGREQYRFIRTSAQYQQGG